MNILHTFGWILFNNLDLIIPGMQSAIYVTVSQVNCSFFKVRRQEKRCFHAQRIKYMLFAIYDQSVNIEFGSTSYTRIAPRFVLIFFPQGIRQRQNSNRRRLVFIRREYNELNGRTLDGSSYSPFQVRISTAKREVLPGRMI